MHLIYGNLKAYQCPACFLNKPTGQSTVQAFSLHRINQGRLEHCSNAAVCRGGAAYVPTFLSNVLIGQAPLGPISNRKTLPGEFALNCSKHKPSGCICSSCAIKHTVASRSCFIWLIKLICRKSDVHV